MTASPATLAGQPRPARAKAPGRRFKLRPLQVVMVLLIVGLGIAFFFPDPTLLDPTVAICLAIAYFFLIRAFRNPVTLKPGLPSLLTIESLFLLFYFILFYNPYQSYLFFNDSLAYSRHFRDTFSQYSQQAIILSTIGLLAFGLGIDGPRKLAEMRSVPDQARGTYADSVVNVLLVGLLIASITFYVSQGFQNEGEARYTGAAVGGSAANIYDLIVLFSVMIVAQAGGSLRRRGLSVVLAVGLAAVAVWSLRLLVAGDRNNFFLIVTAAAVVGSTYVVRLRLVMLITMFASALVLYNAVEVVRLTHEASLSAIYDQIQSGEPEDEESGDSSFATTTATVRAAIAVVPSHIAWGKGKYKVLGIMGIVPFARGILLPNGADTSATVLTRVILGSFATWAVGSSIIADCYMDFGLPGVVGILFMIGWIGRRIQMAALLQPDSSFTRCIYIICVAYFSEYPRYSFEFPINALVWGSGMFLLLRFVYPAAYKKRPLAR